MTFAKLAWWWRQMSAQTQGHSGTGTTVFIARHWDGGTCGRGPAGQRHPRFHGAESLLQLDRRAQQLGHRRVKVPRRQRKSGSGCSAVGSTDTRRRAPRWLRGMESDTRTSRARPSLKRAGGRSGARVVGGGSGGPGTRSCPPDSPLVVRSQHAHQLPNAVVQRRL